MDRNSKIVCEVYLDFIRAKACCACGAPAPSSPDHLKARGGGSGKQNDFTAIPLCIPCHSLRQVSLTAEFNARFKIDVWQEATWCMIEFFAVMVRRAVPYTIGKSHRML